MKIITSKLFVLVSIILLAGVNPTLAQEEVSDKPVKLSLDLTIQKSDSMNARQQALYFIETVIDRKVIKKIDRMYVMLLTQEKRDPVYLQAFTGKELKEKDKKGDNSLKKVLEDKNQVTLEFGPVPPGDYFLQLRMVENGEIMHLDERNITISDDDEQLEG